MKITISKLWKIRSLCKVFSTSEKLTKFVYACKRNADLLDTTLKQSDKEVEALRYKYAAEKDGAIITNKETGSVVIDKKHLIDFDREVENVLEKEIDMPEFYKAQKFDEIKNDLNSMTLLNGNVIDVDIESLIED
jgi:hypothetical protein